LEEADMPQTNRTVLLVEDETLVALTLAMDLEDAGYTVIAPFASCADASAWLSDETPDAAVLDITLKDGDCRPLARELRSRGVPFVLYTVSRRCRNMQPEFEGAPWIQKPTTGDAIVAALDGMTTPTNQSREGLKGHPCSC
jgi:DNA-binding response OmpR family regulator